MPYPAPKPLPYAHVGERGGPQPEPTPQPERESNGKWKKGASGNGRGRPKVAIEVKALARSYTRNAVEALVRELTEGDTSMARIAAANALLDRGFGRPAQIVPGTDEAPPRAQVNVNLDLDISPAERAAKLIREAFPELGLPCTPPPEVTSPHPAYDLGPVGGTPDGIRPTRGHTKDDLRFGRR